MTVAREKSFEEVAAAYDEVRPGYPSAVYDRIIEFGCLTPATKVLEVGVGTGKATIPLAERGFELHGLEPGAGLSVIARANLTRYPRVTIATTTFEDWNVERGVFGLAFCAQAYHWLERGSRLSRFAQALRPRGVLAIFGHVAHVQAGPAREDLDAAYRALAPSLSAGRDAQNWYATSESPVMTELSASDHFHDAQFAAFDWERSLDAAAYCKLLSTYSDHSTLPPSQLAELLARVAEIVQARGPTLTVSYRTALFLARRLEAPIEFSRPLR
jgi:SAM-dependent methyltransferase